MESKYDYIIFPKYLDNKLFVEWIDCLHHQDNNNNDNGYKNSMEFEYDNLHEWMKEKFQKTIAYIIHIKYGTQYYANGDSERK